MRQVNLHEAKTHLSRLIEEAAAGEEIIIAKAGKPIALLAPITNIPSQRQLGSMRGKIWIAADFDEPLPYAVLASIQSDP